ncbi:MAG: transglutaminase family protein [Rhodopirellula sp.]|nr:transglutaminase family protein [Rhodopirellula sp.]
MTIRVALNHVTHYHYDRVVAIGPQLVRLRPSPHCRTPIKSYSLKVTPSDHYVNWQQDPHGNFQARFVFPDKAQELKVEVDLIAEMTVINPFDFFVEEYADKFPFKYEDSLAHELRPFLEMLPAEPKLAKLVKSIDISKQTTVDFLVALNAKIQQVVGYTVRLEPGVQTPEETLTLKSGSCRDSAWLLVQILRHLGLAARFVSGYLIQLTADVKSLDGPSGPEKDFTDLHAWTEVFLPGAGWVGLDPTSGLFAGEGHIPLACTPEPSTAAPISGAVDKCECEFSFEMSVTRIHEDPRVTRPYTDSQWNSIEQLGHVVDEKLAVGDVRLTMGGEPTFVSIDDMDGEEWNSAAVGPHKRRLAGELLHRLSNRFAPGGLLHFGQGKWYPGESLPRWALTVYWRKDGKPLWKNPKLIADETHDYGFGAEEAKQFSTHLAMVLGVKADWIVPAFEDIYYYLWKEQRLPENIEPGDPRIKDPEERARLMRVFEKGLGTPTGFIMPLQRQWWQAKQRWVTGPWPVRPEAMFLLPGDSPLGLRLPLDSLPYLAPSQKPFFAEADPTAPRGELPVAAQRSIAGHPEAMPLYGVSEQTLAEDTDEDSSDDDPSKTKEAVADNVRTALCIEPRGGRLHVFMPPCESADDYVELIAAIEQTCTDLKMPIIVEGYLPPHDDRLQQIKVTPDPGVIEVNVHPTESWPELVNLTTTIYEEARVTRLGTEKFDLDGQHTGTGGGNHIVLGAASPLDSPFLRRPDLLRSMVGYWNNHPSLSYLFSGKFIGPTCQAPRVDEGRFDAMYEMQIAFSQVPDRNVGSIPPWLVDRIFRNLLVDLTGNTHRAEFCIDKLYSPDSSTGRLGLVELRGFEMPPHAQMSLTQQLLIRAIVAMFWERPFNDKLVEWGTTLHDRFLLPHFTWSDFGSVIEDLKRAGFNFSHDWFKSHFEFRFPFVGEVSRQDIRLELRTAIEPWNVLGEEPGGGGTVRFVDSSVEKLQVLVQGLTDQRHIVTCNGRRLPLKPTGTQGEFIAAVRFRAWQPPSCLHPTIPVHAPLVFDILDTWSERSIGGCTYNVSNPTGRNSASFPVNSYEAESRRAARFFETGHTPGAMQILPVESNPTFPMTLDLRRG